ncbi:hypothetical protein L083_3430 [Actinoplanes sp. N902-109]|nr:hypothetical protein L083_3430 [Actinoplanes sp. N902-109]
MTAGRSASGRGPLSPAGPAAGATRWTHGRGFRDAGQRRSDEPGRGGGRTPERAAAPHPCSARAAEPAAR